MRSSLIIRFILTIAVVAAVFHAGSQQAHACQCWHGRADDDLRRLIDDQYPQVFDATIESIEPARGGEDIEAKVHAVYRGEVASKISFRQTPGCFDPVVRDAGRRYIIALRESSGEMRVGFCQSVEYRANAGATEYEAQLARLYPPRAPVPAAGATSDDDSIGWPLWTAGVAAVIAAAGALAYGIVRRRGGAM